MTGPQRPATLVVVLGTATEVGKTWVSARLLRALRAEGRAVAARKPAQSFDPEVDEPTDAEVLAAASGEVPGEVCPAERSYPVPMAPPMAAEVLGRPAPRLADLVASVRWPAGLDIGLVETVGGVRSPVADDGDSRDLAVALAADREVVVADAGLGVIDAVRSATAGLDPDRLTVHLNRFDPTIDVHCRNLEWLTARDGFRVTTTIAALADTF